MTPPPPFEHDDERIAREAEAILAAVQSPVYPRSPIEIRILEALRQYYPVTLMPVQVSTILRLPHVQVQAILTALATLGTIARPQRGYYQHIPRP